MADVYIRRIFNAVLGENTVITTAPALGGAGAAGITLTAGGGAWGVYVNLLAAAASEIWVCGEGIYGTSAASNFQFQVQNTTTSTVLFTWSAQVTAATTPNIAPFVVQMPIYCAAASQIQGRVGEAAAKTVSVYLIYATGL